MGVVNVNLQPFPKKFHDMQVRTDRAMTVPEGIVIRLVERALLVKVLVQ
jgi:hypothetical protein